MNTDSREYHILQSAVERVHAVEGFTCEIGVREGGGTQLILDALRRSLQRKVHVAIDPFGNIEYEHWETKKERLDYTNQMKNNMLRHLYAYCAEHNQEVLFFPLEDSEFFARYADGIPIYNEYRELVNTYAMVFFDGPHTFELVKREFDFFREKMPPGGTMVFDDIDQYPHMDRLDPYIQSHGFRLLDQGKCKISYIKV